MSASTSITTPQKATDIEENDSNPVMEAASETLTLAAAPTSTAPPATSLPSAVEFEPPLACIRRILKNALPSSTNVGKDASAAFARASGIFIIYLTACANDFARENKRQTITANDVLAAIKELDFDEFTPEMLKFLESYRNNERSKKNAKAAVAAAANTAKSPTEDDDDDDDDEEDDDEEDDRGKKRSAVEEKVADDNDDETDVEEENLEHEEEEDVDDEPSTKRIKTNEKEEDAEAVDQSNGED